MTEKKSVAKSIRLTPELYNFINQYDGDGFNEKFSNIISFCFKKEKEITKLVTQRQNELNRLNTQIEKKRALLNTLGEIEWALNRALNITKELPTDN